MGVMPRGRGRPGWRSWWWRPRRGRRVMAVELVVVMGSVVRWGHVVVAPTELSLPGHVGVRLVLGVRGPSVFRPLRVGYG